jgi:hypothetical protein
MKTVPRILTSIILLILFISIPQKNISASGVPAVLANQDPTEGCDEGYINSAIGCVPVSDDQLLAGFLLRWGIGIGGGIAFVMIAYSGFMIISSAGNPQRLQAGRELLIASVSGLLLLVFSVFILRFIGVNVFAIPGF